MWNVSDSSERKVLRLSQTAVLLELFRDDIFLSRATGTVWIHNKDYYLVSNWHVLSGRNCDSGKTLRPMAGETPNIVKIYTHHYSQDGSWPAYAVRTVRVSLETADGEPKWIQHKVGQKFDIAAIKVEKPLRTPRQYTLPLSDENEKMVILPGLDAFVLGFPKGIAKQGAFPIWKRASIASEPILTVDELPIILIDTATREGMSGSPVYLWQPIGQLVQSKGGSIETCFGPRNEKFLGIYSGRYGADDEFSAQLGRVWTPEVITSVLTNPASGDYTIY